MRTRWPPRRPPNPQHRSERLTEAIEIISRTDPDIHREIEAFLVRIYLAATARELCREGLRWRDLALHVGLILHQRRCFTRTRWDAMQFLVHEITHSLLFGLSIEEPLVRNAPDESYKSPLRSEPRPMDGIFHATLVCGRLADFNKVLLDRQIVEGNDRERSIAAVADNLRLFRDGVAVINRHGKLSKKGRLLLDRSCEGNSRCRLELRLISLDTSSRRASDFSVGALLARIKRNPEYALRGDRSRRPTCLDDRGRALSGKPCGSCGNCKIPRATAN